MYTTGNPCPVCRDEFLIVHPENIELLKQFVNPFTGKVLDNKDTCVCHKQHEAIEIAVMKAQDRGTIERIVPHRKYDYTDHYPPEVLAGSAFDPALATSQ